MKKDAVAIAEERKPAYKYVYEARGERSAWLSERVDGRERVVSLDDDDAMWGEWGGCRWCS